MAVKQLSQYERYVGLSTDEKPTTGVSVGSTFLESNTSKMFVFDGTQWKEKVQHVAGISLNAEQEIQGDVETIKDDLALVKADLATMKTILTDGTQKVAQSGNIMEHYGATVAQRPEATEVPVGAAYMAVNTGDVWQSNGFEWVVL